MNLSKLNRAIHRDIGYIIAGLAIIYALSGIALNHKNDWNPNYVIESGSFSADIKVTRSEFNRNDAGEILKKAQLSSDFKTFYFPSGDNVTIFIDGGMVRFNTTTGKGIIEKISKRPVFYHLNLLHYNPGKWWKYFSDIFCIALIVVTITGLFIIKGKNGITRRGAVLTITGILLPLIFLLIYII